MPEPGALITFCAVAVALLVTPGPAVLYIVARSIDQGRLAGLVSSLGLMTGALFHIGAAVVGVSLLVQSSGPAFRSLQLLGAAYLVHLGIRQLRQPVGRRLDAGDEQSLRRVYTEGILVNLLNPKSAAFFLAFLPQFVDPARGAAAAQILVLGGIFILLAVCTDSAYVLLAGWARDRLRHGSALPWMRRYLAGGIYIALGLGAALGGALRSG